MKRRRASARSKWFSNSEFGRITCGTPVSSTWRRAEGYRLDSKEAGIQFPPVASSDAWLTPRRDRNASNQGSSMCRLFGFRSVIPSQVHRSLLAAENALGVQSNQHPDGWGVAFYVDGSPHVTRSPTTALG